MKGDLLLYRFTPWHCQKNDNQQYIINAVFAAVKGFLASIMTVDLKDKKWQTEDELNYSPGSSTPLQSRANDPQHNVPHWWGLQSTVHHNDQFKFACLLAVFDTIYMSFIM